MGTARRMTFPSLLGVRPKLALEITTSEADMNYLKCFILSVFVNLKNRLLHIFECCFIVRVHENLLCASKTNVRIGLMANNMRTDFGVVIPARLRIGVGVP